MSKPLVWDWALFKLPAWDLLEMRELAVEYRFMEASEGDM